MSGNRILVLIDGFNYYHKLKAYQKHFGECVKWLNYRSIAESWLQDIDDKNSVEIFYFSAIARFRGAESAARHMNYIKALESVNIKCVLGEFKAKKLQKCCNHERCLNCESEQDTKKLQRWEEKNSDVNLAITLLEHTISDKYDKCFILSADNDFASAIKRAKEIAPEKRIIISPPPLSQKQIPQKRQYKIEGLESACQSTALLTNFYTIKKHQFSDEFRGIKNPWKD